jgi:hypothetical protein
MTRSQFRFLVVANQLLILASLIVPEITDHWLMPPELQAYLDMDASVLNVATNSSGVPFWVARIIIAIGVIAAIGLCFGKQWGRTLYLLTFIASLITTFLWEVFISTPLSSFVSYLATITEGMILGLAYFSHIRRMFEPSEEVS